MNDITQGIYDWCQPPAVELGGPDCMVHEKLAEYAREFGAIRIKDCRKTEFKNHGISLGIGFPNKYHLSIQGGKGNYCEPRENHRIYYRSVEAAVSLPGIGILIPKRLKDFYRNDSVLGGQKKEEVERLIRSVSLLPRARFLYVRSLWHKMQSRANHRRYRLRVFVRDTRRDGILYAISKVKNNRTFVKICSLRKKEARFEKSLPNRYDGVVGKVHEAINEFRRLQVEKKIGKLLEIYKPNMR
jgi:hypothetical protein